MYEKSSLRHIDVHTKPQSLRVSEIGVCSNDAYRKIFNYNRLESVKLLQCVTIFRGVHMLNIIIVLKQNFYCAMHVVRSIAVVIRPSVCRSVTWYREPVVWSLD